MNYYQDIDRVFQLYFKGENTIALRKLEKYVDIYPNKLQELLFMKLCILSKAEQIKDAISLIKYLVEKQIWLNPTQLLKDRDLDNIRNLDEFNTIIKESQNKYEKYKNNLNYKEMHYYNDFKDDTTTLFYIHGKGSNIEEALMECKALVGNLKLNFIIPQSKEPYLNNQFCWDDKASAIETLSSRLEKLETSHFILAGKSQGASVVRPTLLYIWRSSPKCAPPERSRRKSLDFGCDFPGSL